MQVADGRLSSRILGTLGFSGLGRSSWILLGGNIFNAIGLGIIYPIMPLFVVQRGGSYFLVGLVAAAALAGNLAAQVPAGWLSDRVDRRLVAVVSLALDGAGFALYLIPVPVEGLVFLRFLHAGVGGFYQPAARALLADLTPRERRGEMYGLWQSSSMGGYLLGPVIGGFIGLFSLQSVFIGSAAVGLAASLVLTRLPRNIKPLIEPNAEIQTPVDRRLLLALLPVLAIGAAWQYVGGVYGTVWILYITALGGTTLIAGLCITLYTIPIIVLGGVTGRMTDRFGSRAVVLVSLLVCSVFAVLYGVTRSIPMVILYQIVESPISAGPVPALLSEVSRAAPSGRQGRAQGMFGLFGLAGEAVGSLGGASLFGLGVAFPFLSAALVCLCATAAVPLLGRRPVPAEVV